jgi:flagellar biosynthesis protein FlhF
MKVKKYRASSLKDASQKMKDELGSEAIILSTRLIEADHSVGQRKMFEITAGIEEPLVTDGNNSIPLPKLEVNPSKNFYTEMKELSEKVYKGTEAKKKKINVHSPESIIKTTSAHYEEAFEQDIQEITAKLRHNEIQEELINSLVTQLGNSRGLIHNGNLDDFVVSNISSLINTADFELRKGKGPQKVAFVGPTGVGKTTCIAKLATISKILHNLDVGIISIDTYRLGAIDQLEFFPK